MPDHCSGALVILPIRPPNIAQSPMVAKNKTKNQALIWKNVSIAFSSLFTITYIKTCLKFYNLEIKSKCSTITGMKEYTIIFIGKSGSGKGTQIKVLSELFQSKGNSDMYYLQSGQGLRELSSQESYSGTLLNNALMHGKLVPTSIAIWSWVNGLIKNFTGQKLFLVDGAPRKLNEAIIMDEMFDFYDRKNRFVLTIEVSDEWSKDKLKGRGRKDDISEESILSRLDWFNRNSPEILSFFQSTGKYKMININGEQLIEDVQKEIVSALEL